VFHFKLFFVVVVVVRNNRDFVLYDISHIGTEVCNAMLMITVQSFC